MKEFATKLWMTIALLTATLTSQATLPFHTTDDPTDGSTYWYQIYSKYSTYLAVFTDTLEISNFQNNIPDFRWCFIGNETDGFKIYNERSRLFITDEGKSTADPFDAGIFFCETRGDSVLLKTDSPWGVPVYLCWSIVNSKVLEVSPTVATPFFFKEMGQGSGPAPGIAESEMRPLRGIKSTGDQSFNTYYVHKANTRIEMRCNVAPNTGNGTQAPSARSTDTTATARTSPSTCASMARRNVATSAPAAVRTPAVSSTARTSSSTARGTRPPGTA